MIKLRFKSRDKEIEFFKSIEKYNYLNDACINYALMVNSEDDMEGFYDNHLDGESEEL